MTDETCRGCGATGERLTLGGYCSDCYDRLDVCDDCDMVVEDGGHRCAGCQARMEATEGW